MLEQLLFLCVGKSPEVLQLVPYASCFVLFPETHRFCRRVSLVLVVRVLFLIPIAFAFTLFLVAVLVN